MDIKINKMVEESKVEVRVVFSKEEFEKEYEVQIKKAMANFEAPGFRKGKAPRSMFLSKHGDREVQANTADALIQQTLTKAVHENQINYVGRPVIDLITDLKDDEWGYTAVLAVIPEIDPKDYFGVKVEKEEVKVTEEMVQKTIEDMMKKKADLETLENATLEEGNTAVFDFCGYVDGVEFEGGKAENYELEIGSHQFIPGFEEQMIGMKTGEEKSLFVTFPEKYNEELAGKDAEFKVKLHEIKGCVLPTLDDEFVTTLEIENVKTVEEWKEHITKDLEKRLTENSENKFRNDVIEKVLENNPVVLPDELIESELERKVEELEDMAKQYQLPVDMLLKYQGIESVDAYKKMITPKVRSEIHFQLVVFAIATKEKINLSDEDFEKYYASSFPGKDIEEVKKNYPRSEIVHYFLMLKVNDMLLSNAVIA